MPIKTWAVKDPEEKIWLTFDYLNDIESDEIITLSEVTVSVASGIDSNAINILDGPPRIMANGRVMQRIRNGLDNVAYKVRCKITLSSGRISLLAGILPVKEIA
jgi:hypothetical protein